MTRHAPRTLVAMLVASAPVAAAAQTTGATVGRSAPSTDNRSSEGWTATLDCVQCIVHILPGGSWVEFGAEPVLKGKSAGGALVDGDVLVSVDRLLITTLAGARRLAQLGAHPTMLTVRRNGREIDVVFPESIKWNMVTSDSIVATSSDDTSGSDAAQHTEMNFATTRGWLGIALDCLRCTVDREDHSSRDGTIRFTTPPKVVAVEPGAASLAGFATGDVIRTIDGYPMISAKGAERFTTLRPGQRVNFVVERHGTLVTLRLLVPRKP